MSRMTVSEDELLKWLNSRLHENEDFSDCSFTSISRLAEKDNDGCNWWEANLRCSGTSAAACESEAGYIFAEAKKRFNVV